jgi:hypothetical protein
MSASFNNVGNSGIADDELLDLQFDQRQQHNGQFDFNHPNFMSQQAMHQNGVYSHTPDGAPMHSPFSQQDFNGFGSFRPGDMTQQQQFVGGHSMPQQTFRPPHMQVDRKISNSRSPATPSLQIGTDDFQHLQHRRQQGSMGGVCSRGG